MKSLKESLTEERIDWRGKVARERKDPMGEKIRNTD
jgi:hypothetical protein